MHNLDTGVVDRSVTLDGLRFAYREVGSPRAPAIVARHAAGDNAQSWDAIGQALSDRFRVLALDQRGHGGSARAAAYSFERLRDDLEQFLDALGLERVGLIGHWLGATVACLFGEARPARLRWLVLEDTVPPDQPLAVAGAPDDPPAYLQLDPAAWRAIVRQLGAPDPSWWEQLASIAVPTLIMAGGSTSHVPQAVLARAAARMPNCRLVAVAGAGHQVHPARPDAFLAHVRAFLDGVETAE